MRAVWAAILTVWALFAVVAVLAWTRQQPTPIQSTPPALVVKGKNGQVLTVPSTPQATTRTSPVAAG
jgi:cyanate permease